jgi:hypothetical protein
MKLYFAGPLFTTAERDFNAALAAQLRRAGHEVFLPQEAEQRNATAGAIFAGDVQGIDWCDVVVACMDGPDPDSGTAWECGVVYRRKPVILYRTDRRSRSVRTVQSDAASGGATRARLPLAVGRRDRRVHPRGVAACQVILDATMARWSSAAVGRRLMVPRTGRVGSSPFDRTLLGLL